MNALKTTLLAALTLLSYTAGAQQVQQLPLDPDLRFGKLENGITYYIRHNEEPKDRVNFYIAQKVGSVQEDENQRGLAHFLEHMCFNGSVNFPADGGLIKYCESIGVKFGRNLNAYTSTDETVYNIDDVPVNPSNIDSCLLIIHDWADGLLLESSEIDKERGVIHEEWRMRSSAQQRILERRLPELYPGSKYGTRMPIGLMSVIDNFAPDFLRAYYEKWYRPDLQGIVIVGDINVDEMEAKVKALFGPIVMPENPAPYELYPVPSNEEAIYVVDSDKEQSNPLILAFYKSEPMGVAMNGTIYNYMQDYMTSVICSVLNERLGELSKKPECPYVMAQVGYGKYLVSKTMESVELVIVPKSGQDADAVKAVMTEIERAKRFGLTQSEIKRAQDEILSRKERTFDNRDKLSSEFFVKRYVRHFLENKAMPGVAMEYEIYKSLAAQIPAQALNQTLAQMVASTGKDFVFFAMYPEKDGVAVPTAADFKTAVESAANAQIEAFVDNVKNEPLIAKMPKKGKIKKEESAQFGYTKWTLSNGTHLYFKQTDYSNTEVIFNAISRGGMSLVKTEDLLNAEIGMQVINASGMGNFTSTELEKALAGKQVSLRMNLSQTSETIGGQCTPKDMRTLFELAYLAFQKPADDPEAYNSTMQNLRTSLENAEKMPMTAFQDSIQATAFGKNPRLVQIKYASLDKADYAAMKRIYTERFCNPGDFDFYVTGAFNPDSLRIFTEQYIASLPKAKKKEMYVNHHLHPLEGSVENRFTRKMETPQAYLIQIWSGTNPYSMQESVTVDAFGSILSQRYLKSIREDGGMAYSVSANAQTDFGLREDYLIQSVCPFTPALADSVLFLMKKGIEDIANEGVTEAELDNVRQFELKDYADRQRKNRYWQNCITTFNSWGVDMFTGYDEAVKKLNSDDIRTFVKDVLLKQNNCRTVIMLPEDMTE